MESAFFIDIISIFSLIFTLTIIHKRSLKDRNKNYLLIAALIVIAQLIIDILMSVVTVQSQFQNNSVFSLLFVMRYPLSSLFLYYLLLFVGVETLQKKVKIFFAIPLIVDILLNIISLKTHWFYYLNTQGFAVRGTWFFLHAWIDFLYACLIPCFTIKSTMRSHILREIVEPLLFFIVPFVAYDINMYQSSVSIFWALIAWSLLFYYLFLIDRQFKFDALTKVRNRTAFDVRMTLLNKSKKSACLIVFDLNNLKQINDQFGHAVGDSRLTIAASVIESVFSPYGVVYRIGGDEFCVIGKDLCDNRLNKLLNDLNSLIAVKNAHLEFAQLSIASGFSWYSKDISAFQGFKMADTAMYQNKMHMKKQQVATI